MARVGLPSKYAKMGFKKGWREFKKSKGVKKTVRTVRKTASRAVAKTKTGVRKVKKSALPISKEVLSGAITTGTILGSNFAINKIPKLKDLEPKYKAGIQIGAGALLAGMSKKKHWKLAGAGMVVAGLLNMSKNVPALESLSGAEDSPTLTPNEMAMLTEDRSSLLGAPEGTPNKRRPSYTTMGAPMGTQYSTGWNVKS